MKAFNRVAAVVFVGVAGFITYSLIHDSNKKYYVTTKAEVGGIEEKIHLSGFVYPSKEIEIKPQISGVVETLFVEVGAQVKEGTPIASVSLVPNSSELEQLTNTVNLARINLSAAKSSYQREKRLFEQNFTTRADFEAAERDYLMAEENYATAVTQLSLRQEGKQTSNNIVRSSTSGVVIDIPVKVGSSVVERSNFNAGTTVATIAGADRYLFKANVPEKSIGSLRTGMPVKLSLLAYEGMAIDAVIVRISAKGEMVGGAVKFPVEAEFFPEDKTIDLRSGYSATAEILLSRATDILTLPEKTINFKGDTTFVYVTDSLRRTVSEKTVSLGLSDGKKVQILSGVSEEDLIITNYHD